MRTSRGEDADDVFMSFMPIDIKPPHQNFGLAAA
jgi:hypothetical protein